MTRLVDWFNSLQPRQRLMLGTGGALLLLYLLVLTPFYGTVAARHEQVVRKQADLAWMRGIAPEMLALSSTAPAPENSGKESLVVLVDRTARACGLGTALTGQTPAGETGIHIRLEAAPFDTLMACLGDLQQRHGISVESATIDRRDEPGSVNASMTLTRTAT